MRLLLVAVLGFVIAGPIRAVDWPHCTDALDALRRRADAVAEAARRARDASEEVDDATEELQNCRTYPETYDLLHDGCDSQSSDVESARDDLASAGRNLDSELNTLKRAAADVSDNCDIHLSFGAPLSTSGFSAQCDRIRSLRAQVAPQELMDHCETVISRETCRVCLGTP